MNIIRLNSDSDTSSFSKVGLGFSFVLKRSDPDFSSRIEDPGHL